MKRALALLAIGFQVVVLAWMAGEREWVTRTGEILYLRTAPIDPRDIFRGDFVRLEYDLSTVTPDRVRGGPAADGARRDEVLFAHLDVDADGLGRLRALSDTPPPDGPFLRGRADQAWQPGTPGDPLHLRYGIEQYFVEQGKGREMEDRRGTREGIQVPLDMRVAVGGSGLAVVTGHRWGRLGMGLRAISTVPAEPTADGRGALMELTLQNVSDVDLALILLPDLCSFSIESIATAPRVLQVERPECADQVPAEEHLVRLAPGEARSYSVDFNEPRWSVALDGVRVPLAALDWNQRFRFHYRSPADASPPPAPDSGPRWTGELKSGAFHGRGYVD